MKNLIYIFTEEVKRMQIENMINHSYPSCRSTVLFHHLTNFLRHQYHYPVVVMMVRMMFDSATIR